MLDTTQPQCYNSYVHLKGYYIMKSMESVVEVLREKTEGFQPHTYYLNEAGKCVAYKKSGGENIKVFIKPLSFSKSYRKFDKIT